MHNIALFGEVCSAVIAAHRFHIGHRKPQESKKNIGLSSFCHLQWSLWGVYHIILWYPCIHTQFSDTPIVFMGQVPCVGMKWHGEFATLGLKLRGCWKSETAQVVICLEQDAQRQLRQEGFQTATGLQPGVEPSELRLETPQNPSDTKPWGLAGNAKALVASVFPPLSFGSKLKSYEFGWWNGDHAKNLPADGSGRGGDPSRHGSLGTNMINMYRCDGKPIISAQRWWVRLWMRVRRWEGNGRPDPRANGAASSAASRWSRASVGSMLQIVLDDQLQWVILAKCTCPYNSHKFHKLHEGHPWADHPWRSTVFLWEFRLAMEFGLDAWPGPPDQSDSGHLATDLTSENYSIWLFNLLISHLISPLYQSELICSARSRPSAPSDVVSQWYTWPRHQHATR